MKFTTSQDILKTMEEYFLGPLWRKLGGGACGQPVNQTPSRCKGHVTILRTNERLHHSFWGKSHDLSVNQSQSPP